MDKQQTKIELSFRVLGDLIGGMSYFGCCARCGRQFMSSHDRVWSHNENFYCPHCAPKVYYENYAHVSLERGGVYDVNLRDIGMASEQYEEVV